MNGFSSSSQVSSLTTPKSLNSLWAILDRLNLSVSFLNTHFQHSLLPKLLTTVLLLNWLFSNRNLLIGMALKKWLHLLSSIPILIATINQIAKPVLGILSVRRLILPKPLLNKLKFAWNLNLKHKANNKISHLFHIVNPFSQVSNLYLMPSNRPSNLFVNLGKKGRKKKFSRSSMKEPAIISLQVK